MSQDRVKQVLGHIRGPLEKECKRLRKLEQSERAALWCGVRAKEWDECIEELERVEVMQAKAVRAFGEKWTERERQRKEGGEV